MRTISLAIAALAAVAGVGLTAVSAANGPSQPAPIAKRWGAGYMPNYTVYDQDGRALKFYDDVIKDKIVVVDFIYTSCKDICPVVTARLAQAEDRLGDVLGKSTFFVSISIEPEVDTPAKLKEYASAFSTGPGWLFLTGKPEEIAEIRFKLGERSKRPADHRNEIWLGNDGTGEWARDSVFNDIDVLAMTIRNMDPAFRSKVLASQALGSPHSSTESGEIAGQALFIKLCGSCHTIGNGKRVGPDLAGVTIRRERSWLERYITKPQQLRDQKDEAALELRQRFPTVRMPNLSLSDTDTQDVLSYIEAKTAQMAVHASAGGGHEHHQH